MSKKNSSTSGKNPIVNCHTHVFTSAHVPPLLTRSFIPWPIFYFLPLHGILGIYKKINNWWERIKYRPNSLYNRALRFLHLAQKKKWVRILLKVVKTYLTLNAVYIIAISWIKFNLPAWLEWLNMVVDWLIRFKIIVPLPHWFWESLVVLVVVIFFPSGRNLIFFLLRNLVGFFKHLPGKKTVNLIKRYILIGKFTMYQSQNWVYRKLQHQYDPGTDFVVLPMDMKYMEAGEIRKEGGYYAQLKELWDIKSRASGKNMKPFVFVDPRRIDDKELDLYIKSQSRTNRIAALTATTSKLTSKINELDERIKELNKSIKELEDENTKDRTVRKLRKQRNQLGRKHKKFREQLRIKKIILDDHEAMKPFFSYQIKEGSGGNEVILDDDTVIKEYLDDKQFNGIKIYPALGYYPFDEALLPLWKYAADHQIPIMTHCISGTIFYRGSKKKTWYEHPIFKESDGKGNTRPLSLIQRKNIDFTVNFGHPLNYLCLVEEKLLRQVLHTYKNKKLNKLFGFENIETPLKHDLSQLKLCLAHFGGEEEWVKYLESDRYPYAQRLIRERTKGIDFRFEDSSLNWNVMAQLWRNVDWYSIICSMVLQYPNIYTDISYILSKPRIIPLLNETLDPSLNPTLYKRVLYGTDFYVVRNHFSEKDLMAQITAGISEQQFDQIARVNPYAYLERT